MSLTWVCVVSLISRPGAFRPEGYPIRDSGPSLHSRIPYDIVLLQQTRASGTGCRYLPAQIIHTEYAGKTEVSHLPLVGLAYGTGYERASSLR